MRYADIYEDCGDYRKPVAINLRQVGNPVLTRTPNASRYVTASGLPVIYPADFDAATITVELECDKAQAKAIEKAVRKGRLIFAGLSTVTTERQTALPEQSGICAQITGGVGIEELFGGTGIYKVTLPLQLELDTGELHTAEPATLSVPAFRAVSLTLDGTAEPLTGYTFRKDGCFYRRSVVATAASTCTVGFTTALPAGLNSSYSTPYTALRRQSGSMQQVDSTSLTGSLTVDLTSGINELTLTFTAEGGSVMCKPAVYRLTVFRG